VAAFLRSVGLSATLLLAGAPVSAATSVGSRSTQGPELPRILSARVVLGTKLGTAVRVSYCYRALPDDPASRPGRLHLTVDNVKDGLPPLSIGWPVTTRCNTVVHPVAAIQQPYVLRYTTESRDGTMRSAQGQLRLALRPELARHPELPRTLDARIVTGSEFGKAVRISYCFRSLPSDPPRRPALLAVTLINANDRLQARGYNSRVTKRCGTVTYPLAGIPPPYVLSYVVRSKGRTRSEAK
jgi:hypothetical protein